jgi:hypothetical protein
MSADTSGRGVTGRYFKRASTFQKAMRACRIRTKAHDIEASKYKDECGFALHRLKPSVYATNDKWFEKDLPPL